MDFCRKEISCETLTRLLDEDSSMSGWKTVTVHWSKLSDMFYFCTAKSKKVARVIGHYGTMQWFTWVTAKQ